MKKLLFILIPILLLGGGGFAAWFFLLREQPVATEEAVNEPEEVVDPVYVEFNPIQLPVLRHDTVEQVVTMVVALEVMDQEAADRVIALAPRLNDALMQDLYGALDAGRIVGANGMVDVSRLKNRIVASSDLVLGEGVVLDALVQMVAQRPL